MFCENCGARLEDSCRFCTSCGKPVRNAEDTATETAAGGGNSTEQAAGVQTACAQAEQTAEAQAEQAGAQAGQTGSQETQAQGEGAQQTNGAGQAQEAGQTVQLSPSMRTLDSIQQEIASLGIVDLFGTAKEVSHLPEVLELDEHIKYLTSGVMNGTTWLIVCTQKRIVLLDYGFLFGITQSEIPLETITSISYQTGLLLGSIEIWNAGSRMLIENCNKGTVKRFVEEVNAARKALRKQEQGLVATAPAVDVAGQLERLAALMEKGILTKEEFDAQKAKLLGMQ